MKKAVLILIIVALSLTIAGMVVMLVSFFGMNGSLSALGGGKAEAASYTVQEDFNGITVDGHIADVKFILDENGGCRVDTVERGGYEYSVAVENGVLVIREQDNRRWWEYISFGIGGDEPRMTVYLPKSEYGALNINTHTADVDINESFSFSEAHIKTSTGDVRFSADVSETLDIKCDTGDINASGISPSTASFEVTTGYIKLLNINVGGELKTLSDTGECELRDVTCASLVSEADTGDVELYNVIASGSLRIKTSTGDVELDGCDASELCIKTSTGDISGRLLSDKIYLVETSTGNVYVPRGTSGGICEIKTSTGDVEFE